MVNKAYVVLIYQVAFFSIIFQKLLSIWFSKVKVGFWNGTWFKSINWGFL